MPPEECDRVGDFRVGPPGTAERSAPERASLEVDPALAIGALDAHDPAHAFREGDRADRLEVRSDLEEPTLRRIDHERGVARQRDEAAGECVLARSLSFAADRGRGAGAEVDDG